MGGEVEVVVLVGIEIKQSIVDRGTITDQERLLAETKVGMRGCKTNSGQPILHHFCLSTLR